VGGIDGGEKGLPVDFASKRLKDWSSESFDRDGLDPVVFVIEVSSQISN
jgi:hypothetical protein